MNRGIKSFFYILFLSSNLAWSQDSLRIKEFQEIEISERSKHDMLRLPQIRGTEIYAGKKNEVINMSATNADLSTNNSRQIFSKIPGLSIWENDGSGIQTGISTRGLSPNRSWEFNVRQNGFDISSEVFGYPEAYYAPPTEALERIEIVRGAGSLQYGPQFGGLLNYVTKKRIGNKPLSMESFRTIGSYGLINSFSAIGGKYKKLSYYTYLHQRGAKSWRANSLYRTITGSISVTYDITPKWQINAEYTRMINLSQQAGGLSDSMFYADPRQSIRERNWFSTPWNNGAVTIQYAPTENTKFTLKSFGTLAERNSVGFTKPITVADTINTLLGTFNPRQVDRDSYTNFGAELRGIHQYDLFQQKAALSAGVRMYLGQTLRQQQGIGTTELDYELQITAQQNGYDYGRELTFETGNAALFVENLFSLSERLVVTPGFRYELVRSSAEGRINPTPTGEIDERQQDRNILLFGISAEYATSKSSNIYGNFAQGFRPVLFSELTPSGTTEVIDPNLKDASGYNMDLGFRGSLFKNILRFDIGAFRLFYDNRIGTITRDGNPFRTNIGASVSQGLESFVEMNLARMLGEDLENFDLTLFCNYSFIDARYIRWDNPELISDPNKTIENKRVENAPEHILRAGLTINYQGFLVAFNYSFVDEVYTDAANTEAPNATFTTGKLPSYNLIDLTMSYRFIETYQLRAGINNLTNSTYTTRRAGGYPGPGILPGNGRTFYITIGLEL